LGVVIDSNLSWEIQIERTCSRINCHLFIINRLSKILDLNEREPLYYGLIYPLLYYGIAVWGQVLRQTLQEFLLSKKGINIHCRAKIFGIVQEKL
jgi:hypothetical protein